MARKVYRNPSIMQARRKTIHLYLWKNITMTHVNTLRMMVTSDTVMAHSCNGTSLNTMSGSGSKLGTLSCMSAKLPIVQTKLVSRKRTEQRVFNFSFGNLSSSSVCDPVCDPGMLILTVSSALTEGSLLPEEDWCWFTVWVLWLWYVSFTPLTLTVFLMSAEGNLS